MTTHSLTSILIGMVVVGSACSRPADKVPEPATSAQSSAANSSNNSAAVHDPAHPPIDCPLRKAGVDPHGLKPFEDVAKYISFLERADRASWQKPDQLVASLALTGNETVVDVGAGSGYFTFRFAKALPRGKVVATDIEAEMVRHVHHRAMSEGVTNVQVAFGEPDDPMVPPGAGLVFVCDVLHHVSNRPVWLSHLNRELEAGAKLVIVEFKEGDLPEGPPRAMKLPRDEVVQLVTTAGFSLVSENRTLLPYQYVLTWRRQ